MTLRDLYFKISFNQKIIIHRNGYIVGEWECGYIDKFYMDMEVDFIEADSENCVRVGVR